MSDEVYGYEVRGISPATQKVVEVILIAETPTEARRHAEDCGLRCVVIGSMMRVNQQAEAAGRTLQAAQ